mgnify:CR=1 FL=1
MLGVRREVLSADLALPEACPLAGSCDTTIGPMEERNRIFYLSPPRAFRETIYNGYLSRLKEPPALNRPVAVWTMTAWS